MIRKQCFECHQIFPAAAAYCPEHGHNLNSVIIESLVGAMLLQRYLILSELGRGGMGVVYKAVDASSDRQVAIKMLLSDTNEDDISALRFEAEAQACQALNHPNVIKVFDHAVSDFGLPFMVMEYLEGPTLDDLCAKERLGLPRLLTIFTQLCNALEHAHRRGVVHRDLKPSNVVMTVNEDGSDRAVVLDFGIAKLFARAGQIELQLTRTGEVFGSPLYMSPEQCMGQKLDPRSDIYSFGCIMYELCTGSPPIVGDTFLSTIFKHQTETPLPFARVAPDVVLPAELESVVMRALNKRPADRFQSMHELRNQLDSLREMVVSKPMERTFTEAELDNAVASRQSAEGKTLAGYRARAEEGDPSAQFDLAWFYFDGDQVKEDKALALYWFTKAAQQDYPAAQTQLGLMYQDGIAVAQDEQQGFEWFEKSAVNGHLGGQFCLAHCYQNGVGVATEPDLAFYWFLQSARKGHANSQLLVAWAYHYGEGAEIDEDEAFKWYQRAAEDGHELAQFCLADCFRFGIGTDLDLSRAVKWMTKSAENGCDKAQYELALMYEEGDGVAKDLSQFIDWLTAAAENDNAKAQKRLAQWCEDIDETPAGLRNAMKWYEIMSENGDEDAQEGYLRCRERLMGPED